MVIPILSPLKRSLRAWKKTGRFGNPRKNRYHPDQSFIKIDSFTQKNRRDPSRLQRKSTKKWWYEKFAKKKDKYLDLAR